MKVVTGRVVDGKGRDDETFEVSPEEEAALLTAIDEADRGEVIAVEEVLKSIRRPA